MLPGSQSFDQWCEDLSADLQSAGVLAIDKQFDKLSDLLWKRIQAAHEDGYKLGLLEAEMFADHDKR